MPLDQYLQMFARFRRATGSLWTEATLRRAPHKPILLLAVIDLVSRGIGMKLPRDLNGNALAKALGNLDTNLVNSACDA